jgi:serine/threonine protein phosphatase PrpC
MNPSRGSGVLVAKLLVGAAVAVVVGGVAALSGIGVVLVVVAVVAAVGAFWLFDGLLAPTPEHSFGFAPGASGPPLPVTSTESLPLPGGVEAPMNSERSDDPRPGDDEPHGARLDPGLFDPRSVEIKKSSQRSGRAFSIRIAKHGNSIDECEDAVTVDPRRAVMAIADGASSSFGANLWAGTLTNHFVEQPPEPLSVASFAAWLAAARAGSPPPSGGSEDSAEDRPTGWWSEQGARQGAYSTIVGAAIMSDGDARVATIMCLGDSCAFVLTGEAGSRRMRRALPYEDASQFGSHPALLGSTVDRAHDEPTWTMVPAGRGDIVVLASDALAEWLLGDPKRFALLDDDQPDAIATRLIGERSDGRIVNDDLTVAVFELAT